MPNFNIAARLNTTPHLTAITQDANPAAARPVKLDQVERPHLASIFLREALSHELTAEDLSIAEFESYVRPNFPDPAPMNAHAGDVEKKRKAGELFINDPTPGDVKQGSIADCYLDAALGAIADADPQAIKDAITDNGNGTYTVRFFDQGNPVYITVDNELYYDKNNGTEKYGTSTNPNEMWVSVMEKAYASWKGSYETIGNGGSIGEVMTAITGKGTSYTPSTTSADQLWNVIDQATKNNKPVAADTPGDGKKTKGYDESGIAGSHCYTILGTEQDASGQKYVILRNPWAYGEAKNTGYQTDVDGNKDGALDGNDGTFRLKIEDFQKHYSGVVVGH